jgi:hypothetical protein
MLGTVELRLEKVVELRNRSKIYWFRNVLSSSISNAALLIIIKKGLLLIIIHVLSILINNVILELLKI